MSVGIPSIFTLSQPSSQLHVLRYMMKKKKKKADAQDKIFLLKTNEIATVMGA